MIKKMSYLDKLLDGVEVEWKTIGKLCKIETGKLNANQEKEDGQYLFFTCDELPKKIDVYTHDKEAILISGNGSRLGHVTHYVGKFNAYQRTYILNDFSNEIDVRYLFFVLLNGFREHANQNKKPGSVPYIVLENVSGFQIPIPPLVVQKEIVRILDNFTELTSELTSELTARKKQYNYYRETLLSFEEGDGSAGSPQRVEWKTLGEVIMKSYSGTTPQAGNPKFYENGTIPWLRTQEVKFSDIYGTEMFITEYALKNTATKWIPINCVIIAISGATAGRSAINKIPMTTNQHCLCLEINPEKTLYRYVFHWVSFSYEKIKNLGQGARGDLNSSMIKNLKIPVPSLSEQERIVSILDKFDILTTSISEGLPKEIELRKKQYEYYRDKLLTFN